MRLAPGRAASIQPQPKGRGTRGVAAAVLVRTPASIQPQPKGRGTPRRRLVAAWSGSMLQFSRNPKVAEHSALRGEPNPKRPAASIQPQPKGRGTHVRASDEVASLRRASIQPQPKGRGTPEHQLLNAVEQLASIQPQPKGRGTPGQFEFYPGYGWGFNSAATQRSRNTNDRIASVGQVQRLQFSRNPKVAEHRPARRRASAAVRASIQPQPKGRGTRVPTAPELPDETGFNSAATQRSRNTRLAHRCERRRVASIQPQPKGRGTPRSATPPRPVRYGLQFSRNPKVAEHGGKVRKPLRPHMSFNSAATQRSRNTEIDAEQAGGGGIASIQPQPKGRGTPQRRRRPARPGPGFNSAATQRSRNTPPPAATPRAPRALQFSRNPKVAEH